MGLRPSPVRPMPLDSAAPHTPTPVRTLTPAGHGGNYEHSAAVPVDRARRCRRVGRPRGPASWGVMSRAEGPGRTGQGAEIDSLLRLDLALYVGCSGGSLMDAAGRVLGINTSGLARGVPVTVPVATVERVVTELLERG